MPWGPALITAPPMCPPYATRDDESHMACRPIRRKPHGQVLEDCGPEGESGNSSSVAEGLASQTWSMDPAYYQYRNCRCLDVRRARGAGPRRCRTQQLACCNKQLPPHGKAHRQQHQTLVTLIAAP